MRNPIWLLLGGLLSVALPQALVAQADTAPALRASGLAEAMALSADSALVPASAPDAASFGSLAQTPAEPGTGVHWYHAAGAVGVVAAVSLLDKPLQRSLQNHRTTGKDDVARVLRHVGQPEVYATIGLGTLAAGLVSGDRGIRRAGERISGSLLLAGVLTTAGKFAVGRDRPNSSTSAYDFDLFKGSAFPSGHTTMAFALATAVSDEVHNPWASVALYTAATGTAWSRLNDNKHWLSDVLGGAAVGFASAKFVSGRWRIFGVRGPTFLLGAAGPGIGWSFAR